MKERHKSKFYLFVFAATATILGWGIWTNFKPHIILASCADIADKSSSVFQRYSIFEDPGKKYDKVLHQCLSDAGIK